MADSHQGSLVGLILVNKALERSTAEGPTMGARCSRTSAEETSPLHPRGRSCYCILSAFTCLLAARTADSLSLLLSFARASVCFTRNQPNFIADKQQFLPQLSIRHPTLTCSLRTLVVSHYNNNNNNKMLLSSGEESLMPSPTMDLSY